MAKHVSNTPSMELSHYATILRRRWFYVVSALGVGVVLASALMFAVPSKSTSTTLVNINLISSNAFTASRPPSDLLDMETEQAMARSTAVMNEVADGLGDGWTKSSVRAATEATLLPDGTVLRIQFTGGSPQEAADGATLVAEKYLSYRAEEAQGRVDTASEGLETRRDSLRKKLTAANKEIAGTEIDSQERLAAELARQVIAEELTTVTTQINELQVVTTGGGSVLTEADPAQTQSSPNRPLMLFSGVLGGLLSGLVLAFVVNVLDRRVRDAYDVAGAGGGVTVAHLTGSRTTVPARGIEAEQIRAVRERVMAAASSERPVLAVIDVGPQDAAPTDLAVNLAVSLADSGLTTDLVIVDHPVDVLVNALHDLSAREVGARDHVRRFRSHIVSTLQISVPNTAGTRLATIDVVSELVSSDRSATVTVVALSPSAGSAARLAAGRFADQVLFAVHELGTHIDELATVASELMAVDAKVHGTVLLAHERQLTAHPAVGAGAALLRSAASSGTNSSAFTGGSVSGARSNALLEVMEDLVARADEPRPEDAEAERATPAAVPVIDPVIDPVIQPEVVDQTVQKDVVDESAAAPNEVDVSSDEGDVASDQADVASDEVDVAGVASDEVDEADVVPESFEGDVAPESFEAPSESWFQRQSPSDRVAEAEPTPVPEAEPAPEAEAEVAPEPEADREVAVEGDPTAEPAAHESGDGSGGEPGAESDAESGGAAKTDEAVPSDDEGDSATDETTRINFQNAAPRSAGAGAIMGSKKKKRGRGGRPVPPRQASSSGIVQPSRAQTTDTQTPETEPTESLATDTQTPETEPTDSQPTVSQPTEATGATEATEATAEVTQTGDAAQPVIPANENSWAFTR